MDSEKSGVTNLGFRGMRVERLISLLCAVCTLFLLVLLHFTNLLILFYFFEFDHLISTSFTFLCPHFCKVSKSLIGDKRILLEGSPA